MLSKLFQRDGSRAVVAESLYGTIVVAARRPWFYRDLGVPDTPLGRFDMIALHAFLLFRRLSTVGEAGRAMSQAVHDIMFADMDRSLREMGVGDLGVGKRVKKLASNLYGRIAAYDAGLKGDDTELTAALRRNVFADATVTEESLAALAGHVRRAASHLGAQQDTALLAGEVTYPLPGTKAETDLPNEME